MHRHISSVLNSLLIFMGLILLLSIARCDRGGVTQVVVPAENRPIVGGQHGQGVGPATGGQPAAVGGGKGTIDVVAQQADEAKREVARVADQLEKQKAEIGELEKNQQRPRMAMDEANEERRRLERRIEDLEKGLQTAEEKARESQQALDALRQERDAQLRAAAQIGVARTLGRGALVDAQTRFDARRFRDPAMPAFTPSAAAVAAAGASGGGGGGPPTTFPGSTAPGDIARGNAELARAAGQYNLLSSQAAINMQTVDALAMENRLRLTETFFENRRVNRAARALEAGPRPSMEQVVRYARMGMPPRLTSRQLDPLTGEIVWPLVLKDGIYRDDTAFIGKCFRERAGAASISFEQYTMMEEALTSLKGSLKENIDKYPAAKYGEARTFIDSLQHEFELPLN